jgi:hypothetical protein
MADAAHIAGKRRRLAFDDVHDLNLSFPAHK